ncbi:sugar phosphate isomerase/epimerase family protein [Haladaptatus salinisoli]|uniref:sugar phosphate isomerase/epimerase family protein n=1 Tax=Haladaptatus salinisoli TaxID=2884876 RepID=UPI001D0A1849|nr:sugar phosphate isomerase/epimerase [Haladaptatus salinisoli]
MRTAINLFTLRDIDEPLPRVLERVADAGYDGVEFLHRLPEADTETVVQTLGEQELAVPGAHLGPFTPLSGLPDELEATINIYDAVDCATLSISIDEEHLDSWTEVRKTASQLESLADRAREYNIDVLYHNHHWEFRSLDESTPFDLLFNALDDRIGLELDVGWVAAAGDDPVERIHRHADELSILHVKDVDTAEKKSVEVGAGDVNLAACIDAARAEGVEWFIYEHDEPDDPVESLRTGAEFLDRFR